MTFVSSLPPNASLLEVFKAFPETCRPLIEFQRELIAAFVSRLNHCRYCHGVHTATAERLGAAPGLAAQLAESLDLLAAPEKLRPVLQYARKLYEETDAPKNVLRAMRTDRENFLADVRRRWATAA